MIDDPMRLEFVPCHSFAIWPGKPSRVWIVQKQRPMTNKLLLSSLSHATGAEVPRYLEAVRTAMPRTCSKGWKVCRMHGARGGGPTGKRNGNYRRAVTPMRPWKHSHSSKLWPVWFAKWTCRNAVVKGRAATRFPTR